MCIWIFLSGEPCVYFCSSSFTLQRKWNILKFGSILVFIFLRNSNHIKTLTRVPKGACQFCSQKPLVTKVLGGRIPKKNIINWKLNSLALTWMITQNKQLILLGSNRLPVSILLGLVFNKKEREVAGRSRVFVGDTLQWKYGFSFYWHKSFDQSFFIAFLKVTDREDQDAAKVLALDSPSDVKDMVLNIIFWYLLIYCCADVMVYSRQESTLHTSKQVTDCSPGLVKYIKIKESYKQLT